MRYCLIYHVSNEFAYRTVRQNVIDGLSRNDFIKGKLFLLLFLAVIATVYVLVIGMFAGIFFESKTPVQNDLLSSFFQTGAEPVAVDFGGFFDGIQNLFGFFLQIIGYFSFALFLGFD